MNTYCNLNRIKDALAISSTSSDVLLVAYLETASERIEEVAQRFFGVKAETKYYPGAPRGINWIEVDDLRSVTTLTTDTEEDLTFDGTTWTATDYFLRPYNADSAQRLYAAPLGNYSLGNSGPAPFVEIAGTWGYGDGKGTHWRALTTAVTVVDADSTSVTISAASVVYAGDTILAGTEQMYVESVSDTTLTVRRGVNGTTAADHTADAISIARYPRKVEIACLRLAAEAYRTRKIEGFSNEIMGERQYVKRLISDADVCFLVGDLRRRVQF